MSNSMSMKATLKRFYYKFDNKVINTLSYHGRKDKRPTSKHPTIPEYTGNNYEQLLSVVRYHDLDQFFVLEERNQKHELGFGYRLTLNTYKTLRDAGMKSVKLLYGIGKGK